MVTRPVRAVCCLPSMLRACATDRRYDNTYAVPDGMNVIDDASCSYSTVADTSTSATDYQKALQTQMSFSASADDWFVKFEFSASADFQSFVSKNEKDRMAQVAATAHCTAYGADVDAFEWKPSFTEEFQGAVRALGASLEYGDFVKLFGTHYVHGMQMGGSSTYTALLKASALADMQRTGVDVSAAASLSFFVKVGASVSHSSKVSDYKAFSAEVSSSTLSGIPEPAPQCGGSMCSDYSAWSAAVTTNPQPVNIKLASIVELLTPTYFPQDGNITKKAAALAQFLTNDYCGTVPGCAPAPPPLPPLSAGYILFESDNSAEYQDIVSSSVGASVVRTGLQTFNITRTGASTQQVSYLRTLHGCLELTPHPLVTRVLLCTCGYCRAVDGAPGRQRGGRRQAAVYPVRVERHTHMLSCCRAPELHGGHATGIRRPVVCASGQLSPDCGSMTGLWPSLQASSLWFFDVWPAPLVCNTCKRLATQEPLSTPVFRNSSKPYSHITTCMCACTLHFT